jgi:putative addiction module antidote
MTIKTKIRKIGNSYGIVLPKEALNQLKVKEGDPIYLTEAPDMSFRITSTKDSFVDMIAIAEDGMNRYKNALRELAK